jgi:trehalose 6-phosphate phosphatase
MQTHGIITAMKNILGRDSRSVLEELARSKVLLAFDYDGTLAPIVSDPDRAVMRPSTRLLLSELTKFYPCIVISGRSQRDVLRLLRGVGMHEIVGNHGMEPWHANSGFATLVARWLPSLRDRLAGLGGVMVEDKVYSVAVHYRASPDRTAARKAILEATRALGEVQIIGGKLVVNVLPKGAPRKGMALLRERERLDCDAALFVGDDDTDEDIFSLDGPGRIVGIRVGLRRSSAAAYYIGSQPRIDGLLKMLLALRQEAGVALPPWGRQDA